METKTSNTYVLTFEDLKRQFPDIKGDLVELSVDEKNKTIVVDTKTAHYEDKDVVIHKENIIVTKNIFRIKDKATNIIAEGANETEARDKLQELISKSKEAIQNGINK